MIRLIDSSAFRAVPWKNGGGTATDIAAEPAAGGGFVWRVATAAILRDGPFSDHAGIARVFTVVEGPGVHLDFAGEATRTLDRDAPTRFAGAPAPFCRLRDRQPATAFNLMTRDGAATGEVTILRGTGMPAPLPAGETLVLLALEGGWRVTAGGETAQVRAGAAAVIEPAKTGTALAAAGARAAIAAIRRG